MAKWQAYERHSGNDLSQDVAAVVVAGPGGGQSDGASSGQLAVAGSRFVVGSGRIRSGAACTLVVTWHEKEPTTIGVLAASAAGGAEESSDWYFDFLYRAVQDGPGDLQFVLIDEPIAQGLRYGFRLGVDLQLLVDTLHVEGDRVDANVQFEGRRFVIVSFHQ